MTVFVSKIDPGSESFANNRSEMLERVKERIASGSRSSGSNQLR